MSVELEPAFLYPWIPILYLNILDKWLEITLEALLLLLLL